MTFPHAGCCKNLTMTVFGQKTSVNNLLIIDHRAAQGHYSIAANCTKN